MNASTPYNTAVSGKKVQRISSLKRLTDLPAEYINMKTKLNYIPYKKKSPQTMHPIFKKIIKNLLNTLMAPLSQIPKLHVATFILV